MDETDSIHTKMMESESLLDASGKRVIRSINLKQGHYPCHCVAQTVWYPEKSSPCQIWDVEEIRAISLSYHQQTVSSMLALRYIEENAIKNRESKALRVKAIHAVDYSGRLELFETA